jgi:hypothetical protein
MPRIYSPNEDHSCDYGVDFINGVAAVPSTADTSYFQGKTGYVVDSSRHTLTFLDKLSKAQLVELATERSLTTADKTKQQLVAAIYANIDLGALTVVSAAGAGATKTVITVTPAKAAGNKLVYLAGAAATDVVVNQDLSTWTEFTSGSELTLAGTETHITVAEINASNRAVKAGSVELVFGA